ncbi:hypothetical protein HR060_11885 [Catenovulum sp. SM1970]|uniref:DUF6436 domain-containing protein n=1 Tax=Marinifaba aquimaris TaxID=2741323 RepID=UPI001571BF93|nr:DUF6436 domain-containing protein [Marinifaba aquimaris]NTS77564.1 hypothetical protein [Marinifaba aquimaris]
MSRITKLFIPLWLILIISVFYLFFGQAIQAFNQDERWLSKATWSAKNDIVEQIFSHYQLTTNTNILIHITNSSCQCERFSQGYIQSVNQQAEFSTYQKLIIDLSSNSLPALLVHQLKNIVPATPAALVWSAYHQSVAFIGPHTAGLVCGKGESNLSVVNFSLKHQINPEYFPFEQLGCFCKV